MWSIENTNLKDACKSLKYLLVVSRFGATQNREKKIMLFSLF